MEPSQATTEDIIEESHYHKVIRLQEHYRIIGLHRVWLGSDEDDVPWNCVNKVSADTAMRLEFEAGVDGILFEWSREFCDEKNHNLPDEEKLGAILDKLPRGVCRQVIEGLQECENHLIDQITMYRKTLHLYSAKTLIFCRAIDALRSKMIL